MQRFSNLNYKLFKQTWESITSEPSYYTQRELPLKKPDFSTMQNIMDFIEDISNGAK